MAEYTLNEIIFKSAETQMKYQNSDGSLPAGRNGPWQDIDTPVRNTAHCALLFYKAFEISKENRFLKAALSACDYLMSTNVRPYKASFLCFYSSSKSQENGLIGQAWVVEPLIFIGRYLNRKDYLDLAQEVLIKHKYNTQLHLWHNLNIDGSIGEINPTFNQQLWFAVMNLLVGYENSNSILLFRAKDFFKNINKNLLFLEPGLIRHEIPDHTIRSRFYRTLSIIKIYFKKNLPDYFLKTYKTRINKPKTPSRMMNLSSGYLTFNLYAFSLCYSNAPKENWWKKRWFKKIIEQIINYAQQKQFIEQSFSNAYAWRYNPVGFEIAYALNTFKDFLKIKDSDRLIQYWIEKQLQSHWNMSLGLMNDNTGDPVTLSARLYEASRLPNIKIMV